MVSAADAKLVPLEQTELIVRLRWFIQLRWLFGAAALLTGVMLTYVPLGRVQGRQVVLISVGLLAYNWLFWFLERRLARKHPDSHASWAPLAATVQIILDLIGLTLVLHATGGIENPFCLFYVFHMVIATLLLPGRNVFALAGLAILLFAGLAMAEMKAWLPHNTLFNAGEQYRDLRFVGVTLVAFSSALLIAVYIGTSIARTLRSREGEVLWLERELASYALELERTNTELREADEAKMQYFRKVSHDLKSPLAAQQSLLRALLIEMRDMKPESRKRVERAIARGNELLALLNDLLLLSKARDMGRRSKHEWIDPGERLRPVLDTQVITAREKGLTWIEEVDRPLPAICAEPALLPTLAENLVSNAIKYTPAGGTVTFSLHAKDEHLVMRVQDTGIGVSKEDLAHIGQQFFRTRQARESGSPGTGLGMTIVRSMIEAMRGGFEFESTLGAGTTVTVSLPVAHPELLKEVEAFCPLPTDGRHHGIDV